MTFARHLLAWYDGTKRDLPWRLNQDPYRVLVSEIMLQQTQIDTVLKYYEPFLSRFPDFETLAAATEEDVLVAWKGLGYYRRAKHLYMAAKKIVEQYDGTMPSTYEDLKTLPGIGAYTAAAVASIAFGKPKAVVDGNVLRVAARLFRLSQPVDTSALRNDVQQRMDAWISRTRPGDFNQAMMELGQSTCTVTSPRCDLCPVNSWCTSYESDEVDRFPVRGRKIEQRVERRVVFVIQHAGRFLMRQRPDQGLLAQMWEFPGVTIQNGQDKKAAEENVADKNAIETMLGGIGISVPQGQVSWVVQSGRVTHRFTHLIWEMDVVKVELSDQSGDPMLDSPWQWVPRDHVMEKALPTAMLRVWQAAQADG